MELELVEVGREEEEGGEDQSMGGVRWGGEVEVGGGGVGCGVAHRTREDV